MENTKRIEFYPSTRIQSETTTYSTWIPVTNFNELILFLELTAQGAFTDEALNITLQVKSPNENPHDGPSFTEVGNATAGLPYYDWINAFSFGSEVRFKIVTTGTSVDYTLSIPGYAKRS